MARVRRVAAALALALALAACAHASSLPVGAWTRDSVDAPDPSQWPSADVHYVQTPTRFGDVRVPRDRPDLRHARSFADLGDAELAFLATQAAFAGTASADGDVVTWTHWIDYWPPGPLDASPIQRLGRDRFDERVIDAAATEHWRALAGGDGRFLAVEVRRAGRLARMLVVAGDHFVYARNRAKDLPPARSLAELIAATHPSRAELIAILDCEISYGLVRGGAVPWEIRSSTLPWREGRSLELPGELAVRGGALVPRQPPAVGETWAVPVATLPVAELRRLFGD